jgi:hypothetical protein
VIGDQLGKVEFRKWNLENLEKFWSWDMDSVCSRGIYTPLSGYEERAINCELFRTTIRHILIFFACLSQNQLLSFCAAKS